MANSPQSVRIPPELDGEVARFVEETGVYASKSEFIREAVRSHLRELNDDAGILALRLEQALTRAERAEMNSQETHEVIDKLTAEIDPRAVEKAIDGAERDVETAVFGDEAGSDSDAGSDGPSASE